MATDEKKSGKDDSNKKKGFGTLQQKDPEKAHEIQSKGGKSSNKGKSNDEDDK